MNFKESLVYNNKFTNNKYLDNIISKININEENISEENTVDLYCPLMDYIQKKFNIKNLVYNIFIEKIEELFGNFVLYISKDEDNEYLLLNRTILSSDMSNDELNKFTTTIYLKYPFKKIISFITPYSINNNAIINIKNKDQDTFKKMYFKNSIEGIEIFLFFDTEWRIVSEKSLKCQDIYYRNKNIKSLFDDIIKDKNIDFNIFEKNKIYNFIIVHHKNNGLINFNHYGCGYKELYLNMIIENKNNKQIYNLYPTYSIFKKNNIKFINKIVFNDVSNLIDNINSLSYDNMVNKKITLEGYNVYEINDNQIINYKLQTHIYQQVYNTRPKYKNIYQGYLELYQDNKLKEYLPYFTNYHGEIIHRISMSVRTISKEFLDIYHYLKKNKNSDLYNNIPITYKKILYKIHGIYIDSRKNDFIKIIINETDEIDENKHDIKSITVHDIYHYLKSLPSNILKQVYFDRENILKEKIVDNNIYKLFIQDCIYTMTQTKLMLIN